MCGITAIFGNRMEKKDFIEKSLSKVKHRGNLHFEYKIFDYGALGINRLPITSLDKDINPVSDKDDEIFVVLNGEIFNHEELRKELENKGYKFRSNNDAEVLVYLYKEYGCNFLNMLDSEQFAFILYDLKNNKFLVGRDRYGVKPLYYSKNKNGEYFFASELKQLTQFSFIHKVYHFPCSSYMMNGKIKKYYSFEYNENDHSEEEIIDKISELLEIAVEKRVKTDLPIAVLLSGGVDSSLIMEIANKYHNDVKAYILGTKDSLDYLAAIKLCEEKKYNYEVIHPEINYGENVKDIIFSLELANAQVIRHAFSLDIISRKIKKDGYKIVLTGDNADEIFAGYNEFSKVSDIGINNSCLELLNNMHFGHNHRIDRLIMKHTIEARSPFFDNELVEFVLNLSSKFKIKKDNYQIITKYMLRKVAQKYLPDYIAFREKAPFSNGAGMKVGENYRIQDGDVAKEVLIHHDSLEIDDDIHELDLTQEEKIYLQIFNDFNFNKLKNYSSRIITKEDIEHLDEQFLLDKAKIIVEYLSNKKISRCLPSYDSNLTETIIYNLKELNELKFVGFWGASNKKKLDLEDEKTLDNFTKISEYILKTLGIKISWTFIFSDMHASLNGYLKKNYINYLDSIKERFPDKFESINLSDLWKKHAYDSNFILDNLKNYDFKDLDYVNNKIDIEKSSKNLSFENYEYEAKRYFVVRKLEINILEKEFKNYIFHTFNRETFKIFYSKKLPLFHFWTYKPGKTVPPWFSNQIYSV